MNNLLAMNEVDATWFPETFSASGLILVQLVYTPEVASVMIGWRKGQTVNGGVKCA